MDAIKRYVDAKEVMEGMLDTIEVIEGIQAETMRDMAIVDKFITSATISLRVIKGNIRKHIAGMDKVIITELMALSGMEGDTNENRQGTDNERP